MKLYHSLGPTSEEVLGQELSPNSVCGIAYYQSASEKGVYVKDIQTREIDNDSMLGHYGEIEYKRGHLKVQSELAVPIEAAAVRVGVLNLESNVTDAYSPLHLKASLRITEKAGQLYAAAHERQIRAERLAHKKVIKAYGSIREICEGFWRIARDGKTCTLELAILVYQANYITGELVAQDPRGTILSNSDRTAETPRFRFYDDAARTRSLATRTFLEGRPFAYPDIHTAVKDGKVTEKYPHQIGLRGSVIGFPVLIHGHRAGIIVVGHRGSADCVLDGRDIDLLRRASHLIANSFQLKQPSPFSGGQHELPTNSSQENAEQDHAAVYKTRRIMRCFDESTSLTKSENSELDAVGRAYQEVIGQPIKSFLCDLSKQEEEFRKDMQCFFPAQCLPQRWVAPVRCRCWVKTAKLNTEIPTLLLALQVSTGHDPDRNLFLPPPQYASSGNGERRMCIATRPFRRPESVVADDSLENASPLLGPLATPPQVETFEVRVTDRDLTIDSLVYKDNPYLSFLLSRIAAYPFSFRQMPVLGNDNMATVLDKDPTLPWLVSPLIAASADEWIERGPAHEDPPASGVAASAERNFLGYLTFDNGPHSVSHASIAKPSSSLPAAEEWTKFENDLLHQIALFSSCLAQKRCFKDLT